MSEGIPGPWGWRKTLAEGATDALNLCAGIALLAPFGWSAGAICWQVWTWLQTAAWEPLSLLWLIEHAGGSVPPDTGWSALLAFMPAPLCVTIAWLSVFAAMLSEDR